MAIQINKQAGQKILELGGGDNPLAESDIRVDARQGKYTNFVADFNEPLPIGSDEFDCVFSRYCLEHISWRKLPQFLSEMRRTLKNKGKVVLIASNTEAQIQWMNDHPQGWDNKDFFTSASEVLFGSQDYPENSHRSFLSPLILTKLLQDAGFHQILIQPEGERQTDMVAVAVKDAQETHTPTEQQQVTSEQRPLKASERSSIAHMSASEMFDKSYFNGGGKVGGYAREGYQDFPCHEVTFRQVIMRRPESVLEIGCARGYVIKRLQDAGVRVQGLEVSRHCWLTRACDPIVTWDLLKTPWPIADKEFDLCLSVATLEHIPEDKVPDVLREIARVSKRGLHGVDFGENDDGFDKTHQTLRDKEWWMDKVLRYCTLGECANPVQWIVNKEDLEAGEIPPEVLRGDGKVKLNLGSFTCMYHHGWLNIDQHDLGAWAASRGYQYLRHDLSKGIPIDTGKVDLIVLSHVLEHFDYRNGLALLRDCRRVLKKDGVVRIAVPDAYLLMESYKNCELDRFDEVNDACAATEQQAKKLWALLHEGHQACYDADLLSEVLSEAGFISVITKFRDGAPKAEQVRKETNDMFPCLSLYADAVPLT